MKIVSIQKKDPVRNPLVQNVVEKRFQDNYKKSLSVIKLQITKKLKR